jgi:hypothetical protein
MREWEVSPIRYNMVFLRELPEELIFPFNLIFKPLTLRFLNTLWKKLSIKNFKNLKI